MTPKIEQQEKNGAQDAKIESLQQLYNEVAPRLDRIENKMVGHRTCDARFGTLKWAVRFAWASIIALYGLIIGGRVS